MAVIRDKVRLVYERAKAAGRDGSNLNKVPNEVQPLLEADGYEASKNSIKKIACEHEFKAFRRPRGRTIASERRKKQICH
jgi:hypothetical protein